MNTTTTTTTPTTTTTINSKVKTMNNTAKISAMAQVIFSKKETTPQQSLALAGALITHKDDLGLDTWEDLMAMTTYNAPIKVGGVLVAEGNTYVDNWLEVLISANLIAKEDDKIVAGDYLLALDAEVEIAYPRPASEGIVNRRRNLRNKVPGMTKAISALEATTYTVDTTMVKLAMSVYSSLNALNRFKLASEQYVIDGCLKLINDGNVPVVSEFFDDKRGRLYQGDAHGPNGQSSDMARSFMELHGESQDYDCDLAREYIIAEMMDMVSLTQDELEVAIKSMPNSSIAELAAWIVAVLVDNKAPIKKVWSFVKAAGLILKLDRGLTPYIGMAFGYDAKCSGPQLAALMTADRGLAEACGFTDLNVDDAYARALSELGEGWDILARNDIKKPFMATFYGQGYQALMLSDNYGKEKKSDMEMVVLDCMLNTAPVTRDTDQDMVVEMIWAHWEESAKVLAAGVEASFGNVSKLRDAIKLAHGEWVKDASGQSSWVAKTTDATRHFMPDGVQVKMTYFKAVDANGVFVEYGDLAPNMEITVFDEVMLFNQMTFKTDIVDLARFGRTGFVNLIQATDGQLARRIIINLSYMGVKNIVAVHDCFRVGITAMIRGDLMKAIKISYMELFASETNVRSNTFPRGLDIVKCYFDGVNQVKTVQESSATQFKFNPRTKVSSRVLLSVMPKFIEMVQAVGVTTSYFSK